MPYTSFLDAYLPPSRCRLRYEEMGFSDYEPDGSPYRSSRRNLGLPSTTPDAPADIDTVAFYSGYGPTLDKRIKPEVVAPGDRVRGLLL